MNSPLRSERQRLDQLLTQLGHASSRSRARDMIARGCVSVDGQIIKKPGAMTSAQAFIDIQDPAQSYVSRAALKLIAALEVSKFDVNGKHAVDLGASTGGFTQVLLERNVKSVSAVDVGHGQISDLLKDDPRVQVREGVNARHITTDDFTVPIEVVVSDMSFVSLKIAAEPTLLLATDKALAMLLVKPQFEVGREGIGKGGLVNDPQLVEDMLVDIKQWFNGLAGWHCTHLIPSPIAGGDGNKEFLLCGIRHA